MERLGYRLVLQNVFVFFIKMVVGLGFLLYLCGCILKKLINLIDRFGRIGKN
jgi:hypothetical protein